MKKCKRMEAAIKPCSPPHYISTYVPWICSQAHTVRPPQDAPRGALRGVSEEVEKAEQAGQPWLPSAEYSIRVLQPGRGRRSRGRPQRPHCGVRGGAAQALRRPGCLARAPAVSSFARPSSGRVRIRRRW